MLLIEPIPPKVFCINCSIDKSFLCNPIWNIGSTIQPVFLSFLLDILTLKHPSPSVKPAMKLPSKFKSLLLLINVFSTDVLYNLEGVKGLSIITISAYFWISVNI